MCKRDGPIAQPARRDAPPTLCFIRGTQSERLGCGGPIRRQYRSSPSPGMSRLRPGQRFYRFQARPLCSPQCTAHRIPDRRLFDPLRGLLPGMPAKDFQTGQAQGWFKKGKVASVHQPMRLSVAASVVQILYVLIRSNRFGVCVSISVSNRSSNLTGSSSAMSNARCCGLRKPSSTA